MGTPYAWYWILLASVISSLVSGCGFHLRGPVELPPVMARTYISGVDNSPLYYELESALLDAGGRVVDSAEAASAILTVHRARYGRRVLSVDSAGRASEYELSLRITFSLSDSDGTPFGRSDEVSLLRDYRFDPDNVLASSAQEATLQTEMRRNAVRQILRRLQRLALTPQPEAPASLRE